MSKLSFRARALDASKPMPIYLAEELPDLPDYSAINRAVPQMPSGMEKEEESEHHLQRAISGTGLIIPTPEVCEVSDLEFYERCYPPDYKMPKQHIHMQPLWEEQETPEYDIDTEDERWLKQQGHPELTELLFEQMMDKLEKCSGQRVVTLNEAKLLLERKDDLVIAVYDYWLNKRLNTQHPLILSVKTESRPGQSSNNPYLAFRRRTEKMQTRKNRKNDESSYEKMLKLRRELSRALTLLQMVARREQAKRDLVQLTARLAAARHKARDYSEPEPSKPQYPSVSLPPAAIRREQYSLQHYPPRPPTTPQEHKQREKRPYKRRKYRHQPAGAALREGVCTSSEEESVGRPARAETSSPPDDGPYAFRRKPGCYYEMPTSTLRGDPVDPDDPDGMYQHEIDVRHRFTLASVSHPTPHCVGFARRRVGRGGRRLLDRLSTPLHQLWTTHSFDVGDDKQTELETERHRCPKEIKRDYHTSGKHPWRHNFRKHLKQNPHLWIQDDIKLDLNDVKLDIDSVKMDVDMKDVPQDSDISVRFSDDKVLSDSEVTSEMDRCVRENLQCEMRQRAWSPCSDSSYDSDESLYPVEKEFEKFITEVQTKWLHFRPKTPPPESPSPLEDQFPISTDTPIQVELRGAPSDTLDTFTTSEFTLNNLYKHDLTSLNVTDDIFNECPLPGIDDSVMEVELTEDSKDFLGNGHRLDSRNGQRFGSTVVCLATDKEPIYLDKLKPIQDKVKQEKVEPTPVIHKVELPKKEITPEKPVVELVNDLKPPQIKLEKKKSSETLDSIQLSHGVQLTTVHTKHSPLKKHIIQARPDVALLHRAKEAAKQVRVQASSSESTATIHNGPFVTATAQPRDPATGVVVSVRSSPPTRPTPPSPQVPPSPLLLHHVPHLPNLPHNKLKVLHAHTLTPNQRQMLQARAVAKIPTVVSLASLDKPSNVHVNTMLKATPGVTQFFEIKGQIKGPQIVNVVRQQPPKATRLDMNDAKKRVVATFDTSALKGNRQTIPRPHMVNVSLDGKPLVRACIPSVRPNMRQIQVKNRTFQMSQTVRPEPSTSIAAQKAAPSSVVAMKLHNNVTLPKGGQKIAISGPGGQPLSANLQAIAFSTAQLKARQARLLAQPRGQANSEIVEASTSSPPQNIEQKEQTNQQNSNGAVRRRTNDTLPMEVT